MSTLQRFKPSQYRSLHGYLLPKGKLHYSRNDYGVDGQKPSRLHEEPT